MALEEPPLVKTNLIRHLTQDKAFVSKFNLDSAMYRNLCFVVALFHSALNERRNYSLCGWNQDYVFSEKNFDLGLEQLSCMCENAGSSSFALGTLHYLLSNCTYGGCMEDELDMRTLSTFLEVICPPGILDAGTPGCCLDGGEAVYTTDGWDSHETLMRYLSQLPTDVTSSMMRMSAANHKMKNELRGRELLAKLRLVQGGGGDEEEAEISYDVEEERLRQKIRSLIADLPEQFDLVENETEILKLVLDQVGKSEN